MSKQLPITEQAVHDCRYFFFDWDAYFKRSFTPDPSDSDTRYVGVYTYNMADFALSCMTLDVVAYFCCERVDETEIRFDVQVIDKSRLLNVLVIFTRRRLHIAVFKEKVHVLKAGYYALEDDVRSALKIFMQNVNDDEREILNEIMRFVKELFPWLYKLVAHIDELVNEQ